MTANNEYFISEQVDEQIEQLRQQNVQHGQTSEAQLVALLQHHYQTSLTSEDRAALAHARQRLLHGLSNGSNEGIIDNEPPMINRREARRVSPPRHMKRTRLLSSIAAVLVIGLLLGSWFVVTRMVKKPVTSSGPVQSSSLYNIHSGIAYRIDGTTGKVIWQHPVPTKKQADPNYGGTASLRVSNDIVYAVLDFDIYALDASSGKQIWHVTRHSPKEYFYFVVDHRRLYLFSTDNTFSALDATNGTQLWHNTTFTTQNGYGFTILNGNLYTATSGSTLEDQKLFVLDGTTGKVRWSYPLKAGSLLDSPLVANGIVYFPSGNILSALNEQNGSKIWEKRFPSVGTLGPLFITNNILYVNGGGGLSMHFGNANKEIYALAARSGQLLWTSGPNLNAFNLPITDGLLLSWGQYNRNYTIAGLDIQTGKTIWQTHFLCNAVTRNPENPQELDPSCNVIWSKVINGKWYLLESDSVLQSGAQSFQTTYTLKSLDIVTGQLLSQQPFNGVQDNPGVIGESGGLLYMTLYLSRTANTIPYADVIFAAYRLSDGTQVWQHAMPSFPAPQGANTSPNTSPAVVVP